MIFIVVHIVIGNFNPKILNFLSSKLLKKFSSFLLKKVTICPASNAKFIRIDSLVNHLRAS